MYHACWTPIKSSVHVGQLFADWLDGSFFEAKTGPIELVEILADRAEQMTGQFAKRLGEQGEDYSAGDQTTPKTNFPRQEIILSCYAKSAMRPGTSP